MPQTEQPIQATPSHKILLKSPVFLSLVFFIIIFFIGFGILASRLNTEYQAGQAIIKAEQQEQVEEQRALDKDAYEETQRKRAAQTSGLKNGLKISDRINSSTPIGTYASKLGYTFRYPELDKLRVTRNCSISYLQKECVSISTYDYSVINGTGYELTVYVVNDEEAAKNREKFAKISDRVDKRYSDLNNYDWNFEIYYNIGDKDIPLERQLAYTSYNGLTYAILTDYSSSQFGNSEDFYKYAIGTFWVETDWGCAKAETRLTGSRRCCEGLLEYSGQCNNPDRPYVQITSPAPNSTLTRGSTVTITWDSVDFESDFIRLALQNVPYTELVYIDPNAPNTGSYEWVIDSVIPIPITDPLIKIKPGEYRLVASGKTRVTEDKPFVSGGMPGIISIK